MPGTPDRDAILDQFNLLMEELLQGAIHRGKFQPWEIDIILDIESRNLRGSAKREILREYQSAVQVALEKGAALPLRFSEYFERHERNRPLRKPARRMSGAAAKPPRCG